MSFIKIISPDESVGDVREMYEHQQQAWGYVRITLNHSATVRK